MRKLKILSKSVAFVFVLITFILLRLSYSDPDMSGRGWLIFPVSSMYLWIIPAVLAEKILNKADPGVRTDIIWTLVGAVLYISAGIWTIYLLESDNSKEKQRIETASGSFRTKIYNFQPDRHSLPLLLIFLNARASVTLAGLNSDQTRKCFQLVLTWVLPLVPLVPLVPLYH